MDGSRFDDLTKALANRATRRGVLKGALAGALAAAGIGAAADSASAGPRLTVRNVIKSWKNVGKPCPRRRECGQWLSCEDGICQSTWCVIDNTLRFQGEINPENPCEYCNSLGGGRRSWSDIQDGQACPNLDTDESCYVGASCQAGVCVDEYLEEGTTCFSGTSSTCAGTYRCRSNVCTAIFELDGTPCGNGGGCCEGVCCGAGNVCVDGACVFDGCEIEGVQYPDGTVNPANECEYCDVLFGTSSWTNWDDGTPCAGGACCAGVCCASDSSCVSGVCQYDGCEIDGAQYPNGSWRIGFECQVCDAESNRTGWTNLADGESCLGGSCCGGICCSSPDRCIAGTCQAPPPPPPPDTCTIAGVLYNRDDVNIENECEICNPDLSTTDWSNKDLGFCGYEGTCCQRACCALGMCDEVTGECTDGTSNLSCLINGVSYQDGTQNPANPCQYCDATSSPNQWLTYGDGFGATCPAFAQCCSGQCCASGEVCQAGACTANPAQTCIIGGIEYQPNERNPGNGCEQCVPLQSPTSWSGVPNGFTCGNTPGRVCCSGACCSPGESCNVNGFCA